jgi:hypothetical protein
LRGWADAFNAWRNRAMNSVGKAEGSMMQSFYCASLRFESEELDQWRYTRLRVAEMPATRASTEPPLAALATESDGTNSQSLRHNWVWSCKR